MGSGYDCVAAERSVPAPVVNPVIMTIVRLFNLSVGAIVVGAAGVATTVIIVVVIMMVDLAVAVGVTIVVIVQVQIAAAGAQAGKGEQAGKQISSHGCTSVKGAEGTAAKAAPSVTEKLRIGNNRRAG